MINYSYQLIRNIINSKISKYLYFIISFLVVSYFFYEYKIQTNNYNRSLSLGLFVSFFSPKLILVLVNLLEDIVRLITVIFKWFFNNEGKIKISSRRKFISKLGLGLASIPFFSFKFWNVMG